jgi:hypothetical protein
MLYIYILDSRQKEYIEQYKQDTIMMDDYSIKVKNMPNDDEYGDDEDVLRAKLWSHFERVVYFHDLEEEAADLDSLPVGNIPKKFEIADICFGKQTNDGTQDLMSLNQKYKKVAGLERRIKGTKKELTKKKLEVNLFKENEVYKKALEKYNVKKEIRDKKLEEKSVKYAYIVFREVYSKDVCLEAYNISNGFRALAKFCKCCCSRRYKKIQNNYFYDRWVGSSYSGLPDEINWQNIKYTMKNRRIRKLVIWIIAIVLILAGILGVVYMKNQSDVLSKEFKTNIICPDKTSKLDAWLDIKKTLVDRVGLMHCFCTHSL